MACSSVYCRSYFAGTACPLQAEGDRDLASIAIANIKNLQFVGLCGSIEQDTVNLFRMLDLEFSTPLKQLNKTLTPKKIDLSSPAIRRVLEAYVGADLRLYDFVLKTRASGGVLS
jgi:hypothetical protein